MDGRLWTWWLQGYGTEDGVFCGVFDGHGRNGHLVSKLVRDYLPSLLLSHRDALLLPGDGGGYLDDDGSGGDGDAGSSVDFDDDCSVSSPEMFDEWKEACISAFKAMDRELGQNPDVDCCYSGTTAVTIIKQVSGEVPSANHKSPPPSFSSSIFSRGELPIRLHEQGKDLIIANLGDSRAVLGTYSEGGDPMAVPLTTDLKPSLPRNLLNPALI